MLDEWWPDWLRDIVDENPLDTNRVVVAEMEAAPVVYERHLLVFTALVETEWLEVILERPGGIDHDVQVSGSHPLELLAAILDLIRKAVRLPAYGPDFNPDEAI